jgi:hypothetical protein
VAADRHKKDAGRFPGRTLPPAEFLAERSCELSGENRGRRAIDRRWAGFADEQKEFPSCICGFIDELFKIR